MMNALSAFTGITTARALAPTAMPLSILLDTAPSTAVLPSLALQSASSYTLPDQSVSVPTTGIGAVPFFNTDGSIGYTTLPSDRLAQATASSMTTSTVSSNGTAAASQPTAFNGSDASLTVTSNGLAFLILLITALLL